MFPRFPRLFFFALPLAAVFPDWNRRRFTGGCSGLVQSRALRRPGDPGRSRGPQGRGRLNTRRCCVEFCFESCCLLSTPRQIVPRREVGECKSLLKLGLRELVHKSTRAGIERSHQCNSGEFVPGARLPDGLAPYLYASSSLRRALSVEARESSEGRRVNASRETPGDSPRGCAPSRRSIAKPDPRRALPAAYRGAASNSHERR